MAAVRHGAPVCHKLRRVLYRIRRISSSSVRGAITKLANTSSTICSGLASGGNMAKVCSIIGRPSLLQSQVAGSVTSVIAGYRTSSVIVICKMHSRSEGILPGILKVVLKPYRRHNGASEISIATKQNPWIGSNEKKSRNRALREGTYFIRQAAIAVPINKARNDNSAGNLYFASDMSVSSFMARRYWIQLRPVLFLA